MNDKLEKVYQYLSTQNIKNFPTTYPDFETLMQDDDKAGKIHSFLLSKKVKNVDTDFNTFSDYIGRKKKSPSSVYLETLAQSPKENFFDPATKALQDLWTSQDKSPKAQPPLRLGVTIPTKKEEIYASEPDITSVLKANQKLPDYLSQEKDRIVTETQKGLEGELKALQDTYKQKIKDNPEEFDKLNEEFKKKVETTAELRGKGLDSAINSLYTKGKEYEYLDSSDVKLLSERAREIASVPDIVGTKEDKLKTLANQFMARMGGAPPDVKAQLSREINDVIAQNSLFDDKGNPTIYGWKKEAISKKNKLVEARDKMLKEHPELANIGTDYKVRISEIGRQFNAMIHASDMYDRIISLPDDGGNFFEGFKSTGRQIATLGIGDLFEASNIKKIADKQREGKQTPEEQLLLDAYGMYQVTQNAEALSKAYTTGKGIGGSIAWMGQFALTSPVGAIGEKIGERTAIKLLGQNLKKKATEGVISNLVKTGIKGSIKGAGGAIARTPLLTGGYTDALTRMTGQPKLTKDGTWKIDETTIEPVMQAIGKGLYSNFTEAFGESAGGWFAGSKFNKVIGTKLGLTKIPKGVAQIFDKIGMQPIGELGEEYLTTLMQTPVMGDQTLGEAFSGENLWDTAIQVGLMSGFFGGLAAPSVVSENVRRGRAADMIKIFGKDNVSALRTAIENNDKQAFADAIKKSFEGKTAEDLGMSIEKAQRRLVQYSNYLAQVKGHEVAQEAVEDAVAIEVETDNGKATTEVGALKVPQEVKDQLQKEQSEVTPPKVVQETPLSTEREQETKVKRNIESAVVEYESKRQPREDRNIDKKESGNLLNKARKATGYFAQRVKEITDKYLVFPIRKIKGYRGNVGYEYAFLPKPNENTGIAMRYRDFDTEKQWGEPVLYDKSIVNENGDIIDKRYVPYDKDYETERENDPEHLFRGMSGEEFDDAVSKGKIESNKNMNFENQQEITSFAQYQQQAFSYAYGFTAWHDNPTFDNPRYVVRVKRGGLDYSLNEVGEADVKGGVPLSNITDIWEIRLTESEGGRFDLIEEAEQFREQSRTAMGGKVAIRKLSNDEVSLIKGEIPVEAKTETTEEVSTASGVTPPTEDKVDEKAPKEAPEREKRLLNRFLNAKKLSDKFKEHLQKYGTTYKVVPNDVTSEEVDYLLASNSSVENEKAVMDTANDLLPRVRGLMGIRLVSMLDYFADTAEQEGDIKSASKYRMRAVKLAEWLDETAREWGRGIQIFASTEVNAALAPKSQVIKAKRAIRKQRDAQIKKNKKDIDTKKESLQEANKESVDEVVKSKEFDDLKKKVLDLEQKIREAGKEKPSKAIPQTKIAKEKAFRTTKWADFKKHGKETLSASIAGLNAKQIEDLGEIIASYVREGVYRTEDLLTRLKKDYFKNTGDILSDEDARKLLPKEVDGKSLADIEEEGVIEASAEALAVRVEKMFQDPKTPKDDPVKQMIDTLFEKIKEKDTAEKIKPEGKTALDKIRDSLVRRKLYSDVWEEAKDIVTIKIDSNEELSEEQKSERKKRIADFYNEVIGKPFSEGQVEKATRKGIKELGLAIDKIVKDHYTVYDASKRSLQEKLVEELGLSEEESKLLADAVGKAFDRIALEKKRAILQKGITPREITQPKKAKATWEKLIELTNLGAFSDSEFAEAYADAWGFPKLTDAQVKELERLAKKVYEAPDGFQKYERIQDLLAYQARIPGIDAGEVALGLWYASILSGFRTQFKNVFANTLNTVFEFTVATAKHPFNFVRMWRLAEAIGTGWVKGGYAFMHILRSGYNPIRGFKIETPQALEQKQFTGWAKFANAFKYVPRFMVAADAFSYAGLKEMRAFELAMNLAREENKKLEQPRRQDWAKANEILGRTKERIAESRAQAIQEGFKEGTGDFYRRLWELMEQVRGQEIIEDSAHFAAHGTFNYPPEGLIGFATEFIGEFTQWSPIRMKIAGRQVTIKPAKLIIPFTRIIANVANVALDYFPPVGAVRWATGSIGKGLDKMRLTKHVYREYTADERKTVLVKMLMGVLAEAAFFALSEPPDDDSEQYFEITANGTGDYKKNNELREKGWQPYSIRIGNKWYSYQYTPLVLALAPIGFFRDEEKYHKDRIDEKGKLKLLGFSYFKALSVMGEMTWVTQLTGLLDAISAPSLSEVDSYFQRMAQTTAKGIIYPKIAEQTVQIYDYIQKNPRKESLTLGGKILKDMPIARNKYYNMLNAVGEPVQYDSFQMISTTVSDPFWDYLGKNDIFIGKPQKKISFYDGKEEIERSFTDEEYYNFVLTSGQEIKRRIIEEIMPISMPKSEVKKNIDEIKSAVRKQTMVEMFGWGDFRSNSPEKWQLLKDNDAIQVPVSSPIDWETENGKHTATPEEMVKYNQKAISHYYDLMDEYLKGDVETDKSDTNEATGESWYYTTVRALWSNAKAMAKYDLIEGGEK